MRRYLMIGICVLAMAALPLELSAQKSADGAKAKAVARKGPSSVPKVNTDAIFKKAFEAHVAGNQAAAIELFEFGLKREPGDANGWYFLGVSKLAADNLDGAIAAIGMGRGMGTAIQQARAEQIHDELSELKQALPRYTMRKGWIPLLAQALRLYQPPTTGKYRVVSEAETFILGAVTKQDSLAWCGLSVPAGFETARYATRSRSNTVWPKFIHVGDGHSSYTSSSCIDRKKNISESRDTSIVVIGFGTSMWLGMSDQGAHPLLEGSITVSGNPYVLKPEGEWLVTTRTDDSVKAESGRFKLNGSPALVGPFGSFPVYRVDDDSKESGNSYTTEMSISYNTTGAPFAAVYGIKSDSAYSSSSTFSSGSYNNRSRNTRETILSKTGALDRPGDILEFVREVESSDDSGDPQDITTTKMRVERLR